MYLPWTLLEENTCMTLSTRYLWVHDNHIHIQLLVVNFLFLIDKSVTTVQVTTTAESASGPIHSQVTLLPTSVDNRWIHMYTYMYIVDARLNTLSMLFTLIETHSSCLSAHCVVLHWMINIYWCLFFSCLHGTCVHVSRFRLDKGHHNLHKSTVVWWETWTNIIIYMYSQSLRHSQIISFHNN